jgi:hypothetical protein
LGVVSHRYNYLKEPNYLIVFTF